MTTTTNETPVAFDITAYEARLQEMQRKLLAMQVRMKMIAKGCQMLTNVVQMLDIERRAEIAALGSLLEEKGVLSKEDRVTFQLSKRIAMAALSALEGAPQPMDDEEDEEGEEGEGADD